MKVYCDHVEGATNQLMVQPGIDHPEVPEWNSVITTSAGHGGSVRNPSTIVVKFEDGVAEVDARLGKYLIAKDLAARKPFKARPRVKQPWEF
jgi:hypothetical protein